LTTVLAYVRTDPGVLGALPMQVIRRVSRPLGRFGARRADTRAGGGRESD
jgi:hypothetical protein